MSLPALPSLAALDACGCFTGTGIETPREVWNPPGRSAVMARIGTHPAFKASLLARLSSGDYPALKALTTRDDADQTIALLDAVAMLGDILTFYSERIANEAYLRTANEWSSLAALARLIGYEPGGGFSASVALAFTLDQSGGVSATTLVPALTRAASVPAAGGLPQVFETGADFVGRPEWTAMRAATRVPHPALKPDMNSIWIAGPTVPVKVGDRLVLAVGGQNTAKSVTAIVPDAARSSVRLDFSADPDPQPGVPPFGPVTATFDTGFTPLDDDALAKSLLKPGQFWDGANLAAYVDSTQWRVEDVMAAVMAAVPDGTTSDGTAYRFNQKAAVFGHNAPDWNSLPSTLRVPSRMPGVGLTGGATLTAIYPDPWDTPVGSTQWDPAIDNGQLLSQTDADLMNRSWSGSVLTPPQTGHTAFDPFVTLDRSYAGLATGSLVMFEETDRQQAESPQIRVVGTVTETTLAAFTLTAKATRLGLGFGTLGTFTRRGTTVWCDSQPLTLASVAIDGDVAGDTILLDRIYIGLAAGQSVALTGTRKDLAGVAGAEIAEIAEIVIGGNATLLRFTAPLTYRYDRATVAVNANTVAATHGQTTQEVLGSGNAGLPFQEFTLRQSPPTFVADESAGGVRSSLQVRVDGLLWTEVPTLYGTGPRDRVFVTWRGDDGLVRVRFGDGLTGTRLTSGIANIVATYRYGTGTPGLVGAGTISLLLTRPPGVRSVVNPVASASAADPEPVDSLRQRAPLPVRTIDRVVSLDDYTDYTLAYQGIAKALAVQGFGPRGPSVLLAIAGVGGAPIPADGLLATSLLAALRQRGDPLVPVRLVPYGPAFFRIGGNIKVDAAYRLSAVLGGVDEALRSGLSIEARDFGQDVHLSEVVALIQGVPGVVAFDPTSLFRSEDVQPRLAQSLSPRTPAAGAPPSAMAEILMLDPRPLSFGALA